MIIHTGPQRLAQRQILAFFLPLAATWMMMAIEGPFLAAIIARLAEPKYNLAAHGVAFAFAIIIESPVIMIMSAVTALAEDRRRFARLRRFTYMMNAAITSAQLLLLLTPAYAWLTRDVMGLPDEVRELTRVALWILLPWPGAIGYRRLYQGLMIRSGFPRRVAYGTIIRLLGMSSTATLLYLFSGWPGAWVGAGALSVGVSAEALASRYMSRHALRDLPEPDPEREPMGYTTMFRFYLPLALTSTISLAAHPLVTFFMGQARYSLESLAVLPVINSLSFIFRSPALAYQDVVIALMGPSWRHLRELLLFAAALAVSVAGGMMLIAWTPLSDLWFRDLSGLDPQLTRFALDPVRILAVLPALSVVLSVQRALLVIGRRTEAITVGTVIELAGIAAALWLCIHALQLPGAVCAALAYLTGRLLSNSFLMKPVLQLLEFPRNRPGSG
jgi:hypothetical protein